jgi:hypothetical protein
MATATRFYRFDRLRVVPLGLIGIDPGERRHRTVMNAVSDHSLTNTQD